MNTRVTSGITLATFPAAWVLLHIAQGPAVALLGVLIVVGGLILAIVTCCLAIREGDTISRNRSIWGIVINGAYLVLIICLVYQMTRLTDEIRRKVAEMQQKGQTVSPTPPSQ